VHVASHVAKQQEVRSTDRQEAVGAKRLLLRTALLRSAVRNKLRADTSRPEGPMIVTRPFGPRDITALRADDCRMALRGVNIMTKGY
jgi:hypothetical protein